MKKVLDKIDFVIRWIENIVCGTTLFAVVCIASASVIARYIFQTGFLWADEVNQALLVAMGMFGSARAVRMDGHTEFTTLSSKPKSKAVRIGIRAVFMTITIGFLIFLFVNSMKYTSSGTMLSTALKIPRKYYYMSIPMGFGLMIYEYIRAINRKVLNDPVKQEE